MSKIARIYQGTNEIQKYYQGGVLQRLFFDWKHYIGNELNIEYAKECDGRNVVIEGKTYQNLCIEDTSKETSLLNFSNYNMFKIGTYYTIILEITVDNASQINFAFNTSSHVLVSPKGHNKGIYKFKVRNTNTSLGEISSVRLLSLKQDGYTTCLFRNVILLEGDYTNTDIPDSINGIESVSEREFVKSKNLCPYLEDGGLNDKGEEHPYSDSVRSPFIYLNAGNYVTSNNNVFRPTSIYIYDLNKKFKNRLLSVNTFSLTENVYVRLSGSKVNRDKFQLELGNTPTEYKPFYEYYPVTIRNYNYKCDTDNIVLPNGVKNSIDTIDGKKVHVQRVGHVKFVDLSWNKGSMTDYYQFICSDIGRKPSTGIADMISNHKILPQNSSNIGYYLKPTSPSGSVPKGIQFQFVKESNIDNLENLYLYLQEGDYYLYYELSEPIYTYLESGLYDNITLPSSEIKNEIYLDNDKWYHKRNIGRIVFDGSDDEEWNKERVNGITRFYIKLQDSKYSSSRSPVYVEDYKYISTSGIQEDKQAFLSGTSSGTSKFNYLYIYNFDYTNLENGFKAYLAENPLEVYYELAEPVISELYFSDITYKLNEPLRSIPNGVCDTIEEGKIVRRVGKIMFDGSNDEKWDNGYASDGKNNRFQLTMPIPIGTRYESKYGYCNLFSVLINNSIPPVGSMRMTYTNAYIYFLFNPSTNIVPLEDLSAWKTWLSKNPTIVYYELVTPIETEITPDKILINGEPITDTVGIELPNGIKDIIENGCYIKRVGKVVFDGSELWKATANGFFITYKNNTGIYKPKEFKRVSEGETANAISNVTITHHSVLDAKSGYGITFIYFWRLNLEELDILKGATVDDLKTYLQQNPITVWYELKTPVKIPLFSIKEGLTTLKSTNNIIPQIELDCLVRDDFQNMCDNVWEAGNINNSTGNNQDMGGRIRLVNYIYVKPNTKYRLDIVNKVNGNYIGIRYYDSSKVYTSYKSIGSIKSSTFTFTIPEDCCYIRFIAETTDVNFKIYLKEVF